ncbi:MAG: hypothetical protein D6730_06435 [Bacteroidetes bacterium]|nr:MAG: hypothetical protein D6730_06435 [Bacteroidota bacterium]
MEAQQPPKDSIQNQANIPAAPGPGNAASSNRQLPASYQEYIQRLRQMGVPESEIQSAIDTYWQNIEAAGKTGSEPAPPQLQASLPLPPRLPLPLLLQKPNLRRNPLLKSRQKKPMR